MDRTFDLVSIEAFFLGSFQAAFRVSFRDRRGPTVRGNVGNMRIHIGLVRRAFSITSVDLSAASLAATMGMPSIRIILVLLVAKRRF
jgi:hypothetical protein